MLRNCSGKGTPAKVLLNDAVYTRCPRAISIESYEARYIVQLYFSCKNKGGIYPYPGSIAQQTAFTVEVFDYIETLIDDYQKRQGNKNKAKASKSKAKK